jgi:hypothetical protein
MPPSVQPYLVHIQYTKIKINHLADSEKTETRGRILGRNWDKNFPPCYIFTVRTSNGFTPSPHTPKLGWNWVCNATKSENSFKVVYAQKPQRNCTFMNSASGKGVQGFKMQLYIRNIPLYWLDLTVCAVKLYTWEPPVCQGEGKYWFLIFTTHTVLHSRSATL